MPITETLILGAQALLFQLADMDAQAQAQGSSLAILLSGVARNNGVALNPYAANYAQEAQDWTAGLAEATDLEVLQNAQAGFSSRLAADEAALATLEAGAASSTVSGGAASSTVASGSGNDTIAGGAA